MLRPRSSVLSLLLVWGAGCATTASPPEGWRERLSDAPPPPPGDHFAIPPDELEPLVRALDFEIRSAEPIGAGVTGALRMDAYYPDIDRTLTFKWKPAPEGGGGWNNTPRREIAAYVIQDWFLEERDYVVPPTLGVCIPEEVYTVDDDDAEPSFPGASCIFGTLALWLEQVTEPDVLLDESRFYRDPHYARHLANYNLLTYLIQNRDTRKGNYLVSKDDSNRRVYSIDNGITFGEPIFNFFVPHWNAIRVPALPREAIERLRRVGPEDLDALAVVAEFRRDPHGVLHETDPSPPFEPEQGVRMRDGVLQLGLVPDEIDGVRKRLRELITAVEEGEIPVF